ncbi:hypothetical protein K491DRAFT_610015 [Lophiostoma macrostomum CBS 122681]|uniref:PSP1 C-terminal domain-containing protein n=1 Tax=Lophiostoma macrostomum CBS 122681 TaxID=1314788 RepID=A0A6A6SQ64_9PLEO|nr:hypothetical protein K491DRAFT_610015 [Lophiostoma macrostomum CBS 122681]
MDFIDSDAVNSSDDDRDATHVPATSRPGPANVFPGTRRPSTSWLHDIQPTGRKFSLPSVSLGSAAVGSHPTTPSLGLTNAKPGVAFPWNTNNFGTSQAGTHLKEVVASPTVTMGGGDKQFFAPTNEGEDGIGFLLNQQNPTRKSVRSQSYSIGQADVENSPMGHFSSRLRGSLRNRSSKPSLLGEGLAQLREDDIDEVESSNGSDQGVRLPPGYWEREQKQALLRQAADHNARRHRAASAASPGVGPSRLPKKMSYHDSDFAIEEAEESEALKRTLLARRFSEVEANLKHNILKNMNTQQREDPPMPWVDFLETDQAGRRHSFATYGSNQNAFVPSGYTYNEEDENFGVAPVTEQPEGENAVELFDPSAYFAGYGPMSRVINASSISAAHPDPPASQSASTSHAFAHGGYSRPGRRLYVVTFKCSRADIYYIYDNTGLEIRAGDLVITEGDRGCDLGQVSHADISAEDAKKFKSEALDEHFRWLVMFSQYSLAGAKEPGMLGALARANGYPNTSRSGLSSMGGQEQQHEPKPRMIKRLAQQHEIMALREKEGAEAKAKREAAKKALEHKLPLEILDAEFQADFHKLTLFYYADAYVNFNPLVVDIFKLWKIRIWMSAVNPASVVNPAQQMQPPTAIAPGAIIHPRSGAGPAVGPGFGSHHGGRGNQRGNNYGAGQPPYNHGNYGAFDHQLPGYHQQAAFNHHQPWDVYGRYTPVGFNGYYPPVSYTGTYSTYDPAVITALQNLHFTGI